MAVTYGFYNALNHDRLYDAIQMSSIFDGIIRDGIFSTIGTSMVVTAPEDGLYVNVGPGRAWFNHTWTLNDTEYPVEAEEAEVVLDRIDAVILEVNSAAEVRANSIKFLKGTPASEPVKPTLTHNAEVNQYALAYVRIRAGQSTIFQADVENAVGTDETPFVTGLMQQVSIENLILQWEAEFDDHFETWRNINEAEFEVWSSDMQDEYNAWILGRVNAFQQWYSDMQAEGAADLAEFDAWFQHMKDQLDTDAAGHLQAEIDALAASAEKGSVVTVHTINDTLYGRTCTITQDGQSRTARFDNTGTAVFESIPYVGQVTVTATDGTLTAVTYLTIPYFGRYSTNLAFWAATVELSTTSPEFFSLPIKIFKDNALIETISFSALGAATYIATSEGVYKFSVTYDNADFDHTIEIDEETTYTVVINDWNATLNMQTSVSELYGRGITISKGGVTVGTTTFNGSGRATYKVHEPGTYHIVTSTAGGDTYSADVVVTEETAYSVDLGLPNGSTVLPTDDIQTWLHCAGINDKSYTTLAEVLEDSVTFNALLGDSNACDYMARSTTWAGKGEGLVPVMTSNTTPDGVASASQIQASTYDAWYAFTNQFTDVGTNNHGWAISGRSTSGDWVEYEFTEATKVRSAFLNFGPQNSDQSITVKIQGYDGSDWIDLSDIFTLSYTDRSKYISLSNNDSYIKYRAYVSSGNLENGWGLKVQFYPNEIGITDDVTTMSLLGWYDYACEAVLTNSDWAEAIVNSEYWESVLNVKVPVMTSNTTPSGEASASSDYNASPYLAFDDDAGTYWMARSESNESITYDFGEPIIVLKMFLGASSIGSGGVRVHDYTVQGSNDGLTYTNIQNGTHGSTDETVDISNDIAYRYYRLFIANTASGQAGYYIAVNTLQFYGRHSSQNTSVIHSVPNDTVYYYDEGVETTLCTCDANGVGEVDWSELSQGVMTLYSTTAKDPNNLSNDFSMSIRVTPNKVDAFLIPDGALYWWGWNDDNIVPVNEYFTWASYSYRSTGDLSHNTNNVTDPGFTGTRNAYTGLASKKAYDTSQYSALKVVAQSATAIQVSDGREKMGIDVANTNIYSGSPLHQTDLICGTTPTLISYDLTSVDVSDGHFYMGYGYGGWGALTLFAALLA